MISVNKLKQAFTLLTVVTMLPLQVFAEDSGQYFSNRRIAINLAARELTTFENGRPVKTYKVAVGEINHKSPMGQRTMDHIVWNPWWNPPKHSAWAQEYEATPPGPENPMGPVKMDIDQLYFIHGNNDPISIGHAVTHGCIRLLDEDAEEVARWVQRGAAKSLDWNKFESAVARGTENYHVKLDNPVRVDIYYDVVEVKNNKIYIHKDVYNTMADIDRYQTIKNELMALGIPEKKIRLQLLKRDLKGLAKYKAISLDYPKYVKNMDLDEVLPVATAY